MFVILEYNGKDVIGLITDENGISITFDTREKAEAFAKENCAFEYKILEI